MVEDGEEDDYLLDFPIEPIGHDWTGRYYLTIYDLLKSLQQGLIPRLNEIDSLLNHRIVIQALICLGIDMSLAGELLLQTASKPSIGFATDLLDYGVDIDYQDKIRQMTLLMKAAYFHNNALVYHLIERGANINLTNQTNYSALTYAVMQENNVTMIDYMVSQGANYQILDELGNNLLVFAHHDNIQYFIDLGLNINEANQEGLTPLIQACSDEDIIKTKILIDLQAKIDHADIEGWNALLIATNEGANEIVKLLVASGANVNHKNHDNYTPLMLACHQGNKPLVKFFLEKNAKVNVRNVNGETALSLARDGGYSRIVDLLLSYGAIETNQKAKEMIITLPSPNTNNTTTNGSLDLTSSENKILTEDEEHEKMNVEMNDDNDFEDDEDWSTCSEDN